MNQVERVDREPGVHAVPTRAKKTKPVRARAFQVKRFVTLKVAATVGVCILVAIVLVWIAINRLPSMGPWLADKARTILGPEAVSDIEEWAYDLDDRWNRWWRRGEKPAAHWTIQVPAIEPTVLPGTTRDAGLEVHDTVPFAPADIGPHYREVAAQGDGIWVPVVDLLHPRDSVVLFKTLIHPDADRPWAELFVVAIDLRQTNIFAVPGIIEPVAATDGGWWTASRCCPRVRRRAP